VIKYGKVNCRSRPGQLNLLLISTLGKDYSNPRIGDFHTLTKPFEDMYDRDKVPRMPW
jgi:hypothetical protein